MALSTNHIMTLQHLQGYGEKTVKTLADLSMNENISSLEELFSFVNSCIDGKKVARAKKKSLVDYQEAAADVEKIIKASESMGIKIISYLDADFPKNLLSTVDEEGKPAVPVILYYKGDIKAAQRKAVAIIGTREPTPEGVQAGEYYGKLFAEEGYNIVSGLAIGCDTAGHKGALNGGGVTTSFLAHGLDTIYPEENTQLAADIVANGGLLMSEYPVGIGVNRYNLVKRDRLQAALADATIVIQTGEKGGTMHASNTTLVAGKPLFCVQFPKLMSHEKTQGNALLVEKGAKYLLSSTASSQMKEALSSSIQKNVPQQQNLFD